MLYSHMNKLIVHQFNMSDVEDPEIYAAQPIWEWQQTDVGQWVMQHSRPEPYWLVGFGGTSYGYRVQIVANLSDQDVTFFHLKYATHTEKA